MEVDEILDDIAADSKRADNLIQRLRALFKKADAHLEPVDPNGIVADVLQLTDRRVLEDRVRNAAPPCTSPCRPMDIHRKQPLHAVSPMSEVKLYLSQV